MKIQKLGVATASAILIAFAGAAPAAAYVGPGVGLGVIGAIFATIAAVVMMIAGLVWYPVKVMLRKKREQKNAGATTSASAAAESPKPDA